VKDCVVVSNKGKRIASVVRHLPKESPSLIRTDEIEQCTERKNVSPQKATFIRYRWYKDIEKTSDRRQLRAIKKYVGRVPPSNDHTIDRSRRQARELFADGGYHLLYDNS
jgi:hypothetical protein